MKILSYGEANIRYTPPGKQLLEQTNQLTYQITGTGVNLLAGLGAFGIDTYLLTALPANRIGTMARSQINKYGISDKFIHYKGEFMGSYFVEMGFGERPSMVTYQNRSESAFCKAETADYPIVEAVRAVDLVHICGITALLNEATYETAIRLAAEAKKQHKKVYFDFNYRPSLNKDKTTVEIKERYEALLANSDIVFGGKRDLFELLEMEQGEVGADNFEETVQVFRKRYQIEALIGTERTYEDGKHYLLGFIAGEELQRSTRKEVKTLDRIGAGDAFAAGIIYGDIKQLETAETLKFAVANAILAHTTEGDVPLMSLEAVYRYLEETHQELIR